MGPPNFSREILSQLTDEFNPLDGFYPETVFISYIKSPDHNILKLELR
jgi:hypothetical protein